MIIKLRVNIIVCQMSLQELPTEVTLRLISNINAIKDRVRLAAITKSFNILINSTDFIIKCKTLYTFTRNISDPKMSFRGNLLWNICRYFNKGVSNPNSEEILQSLLNTHKYGFRCFKEAVQLCHTLGHLRPLQILYQYALSNSKTSMSKTPISNSKAILNDSLINDIYFDNLFNGTKEVKRDFYYSLHHEHYDITNWLIEKHPTIISNEIFPNQINNFAIFNLLLHNKYDSVKYLLQLKSQYSLPILSHDMVLYYLFDRCGSTYRTNTKYYDLMQLLYDHIKPTIPVGPNSNVKEDFLSVLCYNGSAYYLDFLLKIIVQHQMWDKSQLDTFIKKGFVVGCSQGRFKLVKMLYKGCTLKPLKYDIKVRFADCLIQAYNKCINSSLDVAPLNAKYKETINWLFRLSRKPGYTPINITYADINQVLCSNIKFELEQLIGHNTYT
jgi:hypothetical protein